MPNIQAETGLERNFDYAASSLFNATVARPWTYLSVRRRGTLYVQSLDVAFRDRWHLGNRHRLQQLFTAIWQFSMSLISGPGA